MRSLFYLLKEIITVITSFFLILVLLFLIFFLHFRIFIFFWVFLIPCLFIFYFIIWLFMISTFFIYQLLLRVFLIPYFLICNIWCSIFHIIFFFILFYGFFFLYFIFWDFKSSHQFTDNRSFAGIASAVNFYKLHSKVQGQWISNVINWSYIILRWEQCIKFKKNCCTRTRYISILIFTMPVQ